jgi:hypothetical protein
MENEVLVYVKPICKNTNKTYEYDFFFSNTPEYVWGPDWDVDNPVSNGDITPDSTTYSKIRRVKTNLPLKTVEETSCYSMEYATYGILALAWIDIENLDIYPENGRLTMYFGEKEEDVIEKLSKYNWEFKK